LPKYTHLLFDHDGVLVNTEHLYYESTRRQLARLGVDLELPRYMTIMVHGLDVWEEARRQGISEQEIAIQRQTRDVLYQQFLGSEDLSIPGVEQVLDQLKDEYRMSIVTTCRDRDFAYIHQRADSRLNIVPYMDRVFTRSHYNKSKPHPEPYLTAIEAFSISPKHALAIEDSERGLRSACAAGIDCVVVDHKFTKTQNFSAAAYRIENLLELVPLLKSLANTDD
jgi:HAD superfamily hydrolase (TIGR01509 family)